MSEQGLNTFSIEPSDVGIINLDESIAAMDDAVGAIINPVKMKCPKHGEHDNYVEFHGEPYDSSVFGTTWCLHEIASTLLELGEPMEAISED